MLFASYLSRIGAFCLLYSSLSCFSSLPLKAQNGPTKQWDKTFGGSGSDYLQSLKKTTDGGYILVGSSDSGISGDKSQPSRGGNDFWAVKLDAAGNKVWDKTFGGSNDEGALVVQPTADGGYIIGGQSDSNISGDKSQPSRGGYDYWIVKLDASGNKLWDKTLGGAADDQLRYLQQTADGGYILGGSSSSGISGDKSQANKGYNGLGFDFWIVKLDANGNKSWDKTFGGLENDLLLSLQQTTDGGNILAGVSASPISGDKSQASRGGNDYWIVKTDANGNKLWDKTYGGSDNNDYLYAVQQTADGGYLIGGASHSGISGDKTEAKRGAGYDYWVLKLDSSGNKTWDRSFGGAISQELYCLQQTSDGGYLLGGISASNISGDKTQNSNGANDYWIVKTDASGNKLWDKTLGGSSQEILWSVQETPDHGFILGGTSASPISGDKSQASQGGPDFWVVKLAPDVLGIKDTVANSSLTISPNPNNGKFTLQLSNPAFSTAGVTVSDLLGRVVLQKEIQISNNHLSEELTIPNAKGMYLLQLKAGDQVFTRKIVVE